MTDASASQKLPPTQSAVSEEEERLRERLRAKKGAGKELEHPPNSNGNSAGIDNNEGGRRSPRGDNEKIAACDRSEEKGDDASHSSRPASSRRSRSRSRSGSRSRSRSRSGSRSGGGKGDGSSRAEGSSRGRRQSGDPRRRRRRRRGRRDDRRRDRRGRGGPPGRADDPHGAPPGHYGPLPPGPPPVMRGGPPPPPHHHPYHYGPPPPYDYRGPPLPPGVPQPYMGRGYYDDYYDRDDYGRERRGGSPPHPRRGFRSSGRSRSRSRSPSSKSRSRSRSRSPSRRRARYSSRRSGRSSSSRRHSRRSRSRSRSSSASSRSALSRSSASSRPSSYSSSSSGSSAASNHSENAAYDEQTKDQRTVFVSQLVQRATARDLKKWLQKTHGIRVREVILLRDRRGKHKGCAYVELVQLDDVLKAIQLSLQVPSFQRFPILIKPSEAEKNQVASKAQTTLSALQLRVPVDHSPLQDEATGAPIQAQKVYVGSLSPTVTQEQLFALFCAFGDLQKVSMQMEASTGVSKGFAFLQFRDPRHANLAIQTMNGQTLAGRTLKTGWASQTVAGVNIVTSDQFPPDAAIRTQQAYQVLAQLTMGVPVATILSNLQVLATGGGNNGTAAKTPAAPPAFAAVAGTAPHGSAATSGSRIPTVAEARLHLASATVAPLAPSVPTVAASAAPALPSPAGGIGNKDNPTVFIVVHNMCGPNESDEDLKEIREEFDEEVKQYGLVRSQLKKSDSTTEGGGGGAGKIYAQFETVAGAQSCASALQGRWFDQRQLQVDFVPEMPSPSDEP